MVDVQLLELVDRYLSLEHVVIVASSLSVDECCDHCYMLLKNGFFPLVVVKQCKVAAESMCEAMPNESMYLC